MVSSIPQTPELPMSEIIQLLTPPAAPSPQQARSLARLLSKQEIDIPFTTLHPILASLCSPDAPNACQIPGFEIMTMYWKQASLGTSTSTYATSERLAHFSLIAAHVIWSSDLWESRYNALLALLDAPGGVLGVEKDLMMVLRTWIEDAFGRLVTTDMVPVDEIFAREKSVDTIAKLLVKLLSDVRVASRLTHLDFASLLSSLELMVTDALALDPSRMFSPIIHQPSTHTPSGGPPTPRMPAHRRRVSSNVLPVASPIQSSIKVPLDCIIDVYVNFLTSQSTQLSYTHLETTIRTLCRVLAYYNAPIPVPSASIESQAHPQSQYYRHVVEALSGLLNGLYSSTVRSIVKKCLSPMLESSRSMSEAIQISTGAFRILRVFIRQALKDRLSVPDTPRSPQADFPDEMEIESGMHAFEPSQFGQACRDALMSWVDADCSGPTCEPVLEEAIGMINDVLNVYDASELQGLETDEAITLGETLLEVVKYVKKFRSVPSYFDAIPSLT
jgi:tuberous sclerosis protein 2